MMIDDLLLLSGNDIPFHAAKLIIHQPTLKEIAYITQANFWAGCEILKFNKTKLSKKEAQKLKYVSNFKLIMSFLSDHTADTQIIRAKVLSLLTILFPTSSIDFNETIKITNINTQETGEINEENFQEFKQILIDIFCLSSKENKQYNPAGDLAKSIADKIMKGRKKRAQLEPNSGKISFFSRYASILATAKMKSINEIMEYTIYQLMDEFNRYMLYKANEQWFSMKLAGGEGLKDPDDWLKDIHTINDND